MSNKIVLLIIVLAIIVAPAECALLLHQAFNSLGVFMSAVGVHH